MKNVGHETGNEGWLRVTKRGTKKEQGGKKHLIHVRPIFLAGGLEYDGVGCNHSGNHRGNPGEPRGTTFTSVVITGQAARPAMERGRSHGGWFGR